ncbi:MAG: 6,7-dimethyl-8-ribityllumazine synthase [Gammaproteobacteria bacterium]|jgi:6,7-dimethyl-8-ribityllumazine synthase|nr:6,7-dimethyl-8-ribityllumazine synthase [Gammaproteobacteria bacterium]|tara:strand:+ start:1631 stop:2131 length:501 start_codon:yes stop_codon:yes gene_type:complete
MASYKFDKNTNKSFLSDAKIAIVVAYYYKDIGDSLLEGSMNTLEKYGIDNNNVNIFYVPGAFEIPLMAKSLAKQVSNGANIYDGIITLGAVIQGETPHFDYVCNECSRGVAEVGYNFEIPVSFGVLTTDNMEQTLNRAGGKKGNKGEEAAMAIIEMMYLVNQINSK